MYIIVLLSVFVIAIFMKQYVFRCWIEIEADFDEICPNLLFPGYQEPSL